MVEVFDVMQLIATMMVGALCAVVVMVTLDNLKGSVDRHRLDAMQAYGLCIGRAPDGQWGVVQPLEDGKVQVLGKPGGDLRACIDSALVEILGN